MKIVPLLMLHKLKKMHLFFSCVNRNNDVSTHMIREKFREKEGLVYAPPETQSSNAFEEVCEKVGSGLEPVKLKLSGIRGFSSQSFINLLLAYTRDFFPHSEKVCPESASSCSHLEEELAQIQEEPERKRSSRTNSRE